MSVLNNILLLITQSPLSIIQASSSFKHLDIRTFTYTTPTFITEVLRLVTQVQLLLTTVAVNQCLTQHYLTLSRLVSTTCINAKATPINDKDYYCHITAIKLV